MKRDDVLSCAAIVLALIALAICVYLTVQSMSGGAVAGCGADSGCGEVLGSRWSKVGAVPVSLYGAAVYLAVVVALGTRLVSKRDELRDRCAAIALACAPLLLIAAGWFSYLQVVAIGAVCPYCMAGHGIGVVLAGLLLAVTLGSRGIKPATPITLGVAAGIALIALQWWVLPTEGETASTPNPFADRDGDTWVGDKRFVSLFGGQVQLVLQEQPYLGEPDAQQVVAVLFDYACPHCRRLHALMHQAQQADPGRFVVVPLPLTIDEAHNPFVGSDNPRFDDSLELATLSLAVAAIDREAWVDFDRWLFAEDDSASDFPRSAADARAEAESLVGKDKLDAELAGLTRDRIDAQLERNTAVLGTLPPDQRYIPVTTTPGAPRHLTERYDDPAVLLELLEEAKANLTPGPKPAD